MSPRSRSTLTVDDLGEGRLSAQGTTRGAALVLLFIPALCLTVYLANGVASWGVAALVSFAALLPGAIWLGLRSETLTIDSGYVRWRVRVAGRSIREADAPIGCIESVGIRREVSTVEGYSEEFAVEMRLAAPQLPPWIVIFSSENQAESTAEALRVGDALAARVDTEPKRG